MTITAAMVKELRELTGAGMMDCKKALGETDGDMDAAVEVLKKSGMAKVEKKASRIAAEGITRVASNGNTAVVVEVNSETDFVAKNTTFHEFVQEVADKALTASVDKAGDGEDVVSILGMQSQLQEKTLTIGKPFFVDKSRTKAQTHATRHRYNKVLAAFHGSMFRNDSLCCQGEQTYSHCGNSRQHNSSRTSLF